MPAYRLPVRADCLRWTRAPTLARFRFHHMGQPPGPLYLWPLEQVFQPPLLA